jgi:hypothetical protein
LIQAGEIMMDTYIPDEEILRLPDIQLGRSLGAKWKNYDIEMPDGDTLNLTEGTKITNVEVIAGKGKNRQIDEIDGLIEEFGGNPSEWQKIKGIDYVDNDGDSFRAELHWYEEKSIGKVKFKLKPQRGGNWYVEE